MVMKTENPDIKAPLAQFFGDISPEQNLQRWDAIEDVIEDLGLNVKLKDGSEIKMEKSKKNPIVSKFQIIHLGIRMLRPQLMPDSQGPGKLTVPSIIHSVCQYFNSSRNYHRSWSVQLRLLLIPSRCVPCSLNQLYTLRYGTISVVHATGRLRDAVENFNHNTEVGAGAGTGFWRRMLGITLDVTKNMIVEVQCTHLSSHHGRLRLLLIPSRCVPCSLNQLYALRYGTISVVHATGRLRDAVENFNHNSEVGAGAGTG
ncbi:hypothetical protein DY000_02055616 [Brassica cretica]|uniref:Uncharacterized protein n=1 Tax=Brassica cretica TaxID=69181 RepID=A0ABQ7AFZ3_BRACR|nr:hypothetical protein DY000_02055616 [Brassica cretica]